LKNFVHVPRNSAPGWALLVPLAIALISFKCTLVHIMKTKNPMCPHCRQYCHFPPTPQIEIGREGPNHWHALPKNCPACGKFILIIRCLDIRTTHVLLSFEAWPKGTSRNSAPPEVPDSIAQSYNESCALLSISPTASAALSRRALQNLLRDVVGVKHGDLFGEIQEVLDSKKLPSGLADNIDAVRVIGNFAAHPMKCKTTGDILPVEEGEAEWTLDVLESLFDFYCVQPAIEKKKRDELNAKLQKAGKPPIR
jgi:hypothetical protein